MQKGKTNNPKGRSVGIPNPTTRVGWVGVMDVRQLAKAWTTESINTLGQIMTDVASPPATRVAAAQALLDRGWGKPSQTIEATINNFEDRSDDELRRLIAGTIVANSPDSGRIELEGFEEELSE
ncbi:hypothetical protein [Chryseobacterium cucumeris]|uniref:hypothetical protein n=1 Tax=Chryseobacterium cucumeris TaxID=1813611 RepID=UPI0023F47666|nr:hypothetical protein [Chryseobacterium cucumeris]